MGYHREDLELDIIEEGGACASCASGEGSVCTTHVGGGAGWRQLMMDLGQGSQWEGHVCGRGDQVVVDLASIF